MTGTLEPRHLVALLASTEPRVQHAARSALEAIGPAARSALEGGLTHPDHAVRAACADLLGARSALLGRLLRALRPAAERADVPTPQAH